MEGGEWGCVGTFSKINVNYFDMAKWILINLKSLKKTSWVINRPLNGILVIAYLAVRGRFPP